MNLIEALNNSPVDLVVRALRRLGLQTRSEDHTSSRPFEPDHEAVPVLLYGVARSGTTTAQRMMAENLSYNRVFEPIGFCFPELNPQKHLEFQRTFRSYPSSERMDVERIAGGLYGACGAEDFDVHLRLRLKDTLLKLFESIFATFGRNVVIKELRLLGAHPLVFEVLREMGVTPKVYFLRMNPWATLYSFYRIGGFGFHHGVNMVECIYNYRLGWCEQYGIKVNDIWLNPNNNFERLLAAILLEWEMADQLIVASGEGELLEFGSELDQKMASSFHAKNWHYESNSPIHISDPCRFASDPHFLRLCRNRIRKPIIQIMEQIGYNLPNKAERGGSRLQKSFTYASYSISQSLIRPQ